MVRTPKKNGPINITRIASEAGLSIASVSRAMNGKNGVSEEVRRRVNELLVKHNYIADARFENQKRIAVIFSLGSFGSYQTELFYGMSDAAREYGIDFCAVCHSRESRRSLLQEVRELQCSGAVIILPDQFGEELMELAGSEVKVILVDRSDGGGKFGFIDHDSYAGSLDAVRHLIQLGHRKIGYLYHQGRSLNHLQRRKGYEHAMEEANLACDSGWCACAGGTIQENAAHAKELLQAHPELTAVAATNDDVAMGIYRAAWELKLRIPEDLSVVGFDDLPQSCCMTPALTTVRHSIYEIGFRALHELDQSLRDPKRPLPLELVPTRLIVRESTGKPANP